MSEATTTPWGCTKERIFQALPPIWPESLLTEIRERISSRKSKIIVLDDDPTGTQTVYDIPVITEYSAASLAREIRTLGPGFYVLTNSRSLTPQESQLLHRELASNLLEALQSQAPPAAATEVCLISRSDSTLRGHFPMEIEVLAEVLGSPDAVFIVPFFAEGGRLTIDNVHYLAEGDVLTPVARTPFAQDPVFAYQACNLREWVVEKAQGTISGDRIRSISLDDIRCGGPNRVLELIWTLPKGTFCIVNAVDYRDLEVFTLATLEAEAQGRWFLFRSAASFVATRFGLEAKPPLTVNELCSGDSQIGGLVVCGSYVPLSSQQLANLCKQKGITAIEFDVRKFVNALSPDAYLKQLGDEIRCQLLAGNHVVLFTSRQVIKNFPPQESLVIGRRIAAALAHVVRDLAVRPRFLIAKGGITASELATKGLGVTRAIVRGQALPGVPVWELDESSLYPGLKFIIFPGNIGEANSLALLVQRLTSVN